uniref:Uncharacterized protein n=1 Tax=Cryptomonas curvata TaxID=233186 RepID=A0A7S0MNA0_9CRYP
MQRRMTQHKTPPKLRTLRVETRPTCIGAHRLFLKNRFIKKLPAREPSAYLAVEISSAIRYVSLTVIGEKRSPSVHFSSALRCFLLWETMRKERATARLSSCNAEELLLDLIPQHPL